MKQAISQAKMAQKLNEVPVGAVIAKDGEIISIAHNERDKNMQAADHAEMLAIRRACKKLKSWRLTGCDIFVTLEPCPMCAGAIITARIQNVYFGCYDKKSGAFGGVVDFSTFKWSHKPNIYGGFFGYLKCPVILPFQLSRQFSSRGAGPIL